LVACDRNDPAKVDARRLGAWCGSIEDRVFGELQLTRDGSVRRATLWKVSCVSSVSSKTATQNEAMHAGSSASDVVPENGPASYSIHRPQNDSPDSQNSHGDQVDEEGFEV